VNDHIAEQQHTLVADLHRSRTGGTPCRVANASARRLMPLKS
jgi:hypothetical protein